MSGFGKFINSFGIDSEKYFYNYKKGNNIFYELRICFFRKSINSN